MTVLPDLEALKPLLAALPATRSAGLTLLRYKVKLITPMLGGGVEAGKPDLHQPIRARSLRGQFRFWWRLLARGGMFGACVSSQNTPSPDDWRNWERSVWGGMGDKPGEVMASTVGLAVSVLNAPELIDFDVEEFGKCMDPIRKKDADPNLALAWCRYVFFSAEGRDGQAPKKVVKPGLRFRLDVAVNSPDPATADMVRQVVKFWATFGGIGSRTRRGAGAVQVVDLTDGQNTLMCALTDGSASRCTAIRVVTGPAATVYEAYKSSILPMIEFRQKPALARPETMDRPKTYGMSPAKRWATPRSKTMDRPKTYGMSLWPEAHEIRKAAGVSLPAHAPAVSKWDDCDYPMPRAAFGLPIVVHFKDRRNTSSKADDPGFDPADRTILPVVNDDVLERMASPLILRPVAVSSTNFRSCTLYFDSLAMGDEPLQVVSITRSDAAHAIVKKWSVWDATWTGVVPSHALPPALSRYRTANGLPGGFSPARSAVEAYFNYRLIKAAAAPKPKP